MEGHRDGALLEQRVEADELTRFVGQNEIRHVVAGLRRVVADIVLPQAIHQLIDGSLKLRAEPPHRIGHHGYHSHPDRWGGCAPLPDGTRDGP